MSSQYYSQVGQDEFLDKFVFKGLKDGTFLDLGAFDGVKFSNTYFFEKKFCWKGWCFEPIPKIFKELKKNRKCVCYNNCIGNKEDIVRFSFVESNPMLSGISKNLSERDAERIKMEKNPPKIITSKVINIKKFLAENKIKEIHLLSLDIEGNEEKVLRAINFEKVFVHTICLEDNYGEKKIDSFLNKQGFVLLKHNGFDKIFVNKKSKFYPKKNLKLIIRARIVKRLYSPRIHKILKILVNKFPRLRVIKRKMLKISLKSS